MSPPLVIWGPYAFNITFITVDITFITVDITIITLGLFYKLQLSENSFTNVKVNS